MTRLTEEMVIARSKQSDLGSIKKLNCWGCDLTDVSILKRMSGVEVLALSVNKITTLQPFENCSNLQVLFLRNNNIRDINEIAYLQNLPDLKHLWLEGNPCCDSVGANYRAIVLRALPKLEKLDKTDVTPEEIEDALKPISKMDNPEESTFQQQPPQQQPQQQQQYKSNQQNLPSQQYHPVLQSPSREPIGQQSNSIVTDESINENNNSSSSNNNHHNNNNHNHNHNNNYNVTNHSKISTPSQRSPDTDQGSIHGGGGGFRERVPIPPSASTHSMKEYYHSDRLSHPAHYRHSQHDLSEWEEHQFHNQGNQSHYSSRRNVAADRSVEMLDRCHRNNHDYADWEDERCRPRRSDVRYGDSSSTISNAVLNHYSNIHRRPLHRNSNLLSATLCLVKELDYPSLEVVEHAVRCRIDELSTD